MKDQTYPSEGARIAKWFWGASGELHFPDTTREEKRLDQHGSEFAAKAPRAKHLE